VNLVDARRAEALKLLQIKVEELLHNIEINVGLL
jgi:hypothetical protein